MRTTASSTVRQLVALGIALGVASSAHAQDATAPAPAPAAPPDAAPAPAPAAPAPAPAPATVVTPAPALATAPPAPAAPPPPGTYGRSPTSEVVEGELSSLGTTELVLHDTRIGLALGPSLIGANYYLSGALEFDIHFGQNFGLGLWLPVNVPLYEPSQGLKFFPQASPGCKGIGCYIRPQDYDTPAKFVRILRYLTIGHKEGDFFLDFSTDYAATIGHGTAIRRYATNINLDDARLLGEMDAKFKYGGFELMVGNVVTPLNMMGALLYLKPAGFSENVMLQRLSIGLEYAGDWFAPMKVKSFCGAGSATCSTGGPSDFPVLDSTGDQIAVANTAAVHFIGLSVETKVVKTDNIDIKPYLDFSKMVVSSNVKPEGFKGGMEGGGFTLGALGRLGFGEKIRSAFRVILEGRLFQPNYIPGYFDSFYEVQKYQYITNGATPVTQIPTKLAAVLGREPNAAGVSTGCGTGTSTCPGWMPGGYGEISYSLVNVFAVTAAAQTSNVPGGTNVVVHAEVPTFEWLKFFASMYRVNLGESGVVVPNSVSKILTDDNTLVFTGARLKILPVLFLNAQYIRAWLLDTTGTTNSYQISNMVQVTLEGGLEFSH